MRKRETKLKLTFIGMAGVIVILVYLLIYEYILS
jgi:hypothetical protein